MFTCGKGCKWDGLSKAHCAAECHLTYSRESSFNRHRRGGKCLTPEEAGLEARQGNDFIYYAVPFTGTPYWSSEPSTVDTEGQE